MNLLSLWRSRGGLPTYLPERYAVPPLERREEGIAIGVPFIDSLEGEAGITTKKLPVAD